MLYDLYRAEGSFISVRTYRLISGLQIRSLTPDDAHNLAYIELEIFPSPWDESSLRSFLALPNVEGEAAVQNNRIIGYIFVQYAAGEVHILNLGIRPDFRRKGLASLLLKRFLDRSRKRGVEVCYLEVRAGNIAAQRLYFGYGFAPVSLRKRYYPDGEDALILVKQFY